jgi:hypothetical protein
MVKVALIERCPPLFCNSIACMIGWNVKRLLTSLAEHSPSISTITLTSYVPRPVLADRLSIDSSLSLSPSLFVQEALRHRGYPNAIETYPVEMLADRLAGPPLDGAVRGLCSRVHLLDGTEAQLPLLDFQCSVTDENAAALLEAMRLMGQTWGVLATSGRSYHYYGFEPITLEKWRRFMAHSVLLAPLIDVRYLAHCMIEDMACLRIDARPNQHTEPVVVAVLK